MKNSHLFAIARFTQPSWISEMNERRNEQAKNAQLSDEHWACQMDQDEAYIEQQVGQE